MTSFRLKEEKRCLHVHWSLQPTHFLKDWMPIFIVDPVLFWPLNDKKASTVLEKKHMIIQLIGGPLGYSFMNY